MSSFIVYTLVKSSVSCILAFQAYQYLHEEKKEESTNGTRILTSFVLIALLTIIEYSIEPFIYWLPLYYELKTLLLLGIAFILYSKKDVNLLSYIDPLFSQFDERVAPSVIKVSNLVLYYCIVIVSPFVNQNQLSSMREYLRKASSSLDDAMASNPVPTDQPIPSAQLYATLPRGMFPVC
ncbi:hypothetical protein WA588_000471 [Blastocystis sp. NMH]